MRAVAMEDAGVLLAWRNDPVTRAASLSTAAVDMPAHLDWLSRTISAPDRLLYIGERDGVAVGTVRFDLDGDDPDAAEVSITVGPSHRGRKLSLPLLRAGLATFVGDARGRSVIHAVIRVENSASRALFDAAGFREVSRNDGVLSLVQDLSRERPS